MPARQQHHQQRQQERCHDHGQHKQDGAVHRPRLCDKVGARLMGGAGENLQHALVDVVARQSRRVLRIHERGRRRRRQLLREPRAAHRRRLQLLEGVQKVYRGTRRERVRRVQLRHGLRIGGVSEAQRIVGGVRQHLSLVGGLHAQYGQREQVGAAVGERRIHKGVKVGEAGESVRADHIRQPFCVGVIPQQAAKPEHRRRGAQRERRQVVLVRRRSAVGARIKSVAVGEKVHPTLQRAAVMGIEWAKRRLPYRVGAGQLIPADGVVLRKVRRGGHERLRDHVLVGVVGGGVGVQRRALVGEHKVAGDVPQPAAAVALLP
eukprot:ctg_1812.g694